MKKIILVITVIAFFFVGCQTNQLNDVIDENISIIDEQSNDVEESSDTESDDIIEALVALEALKYDVSEEEILQGFADENQTAYEAYKTAADVLGISLEEYLVYAKDSYENLTDEQLETLRAMNNVTDALEETTELISHVGGEKSGDELLEVIELINIEVETIVEEDGGDGWMYMTYSTLKPCDEVIDYFTEMLKGTDGYSITQFSGADFAFIQGTLESGVLQIEIENDDGDEFTTVVYTYTY